MIKEIKFYRSSQPFGFLSNLYPVSVYFEDKLFKSSEEAYQYGKPKDKKLAEWIISAPSQKYVAFAGHSVVTEDIIPDWDKIKIERMYAVIQAKFEQNLNLRKKIMDRWREKIEVKVR